MVAVDPRRRWVSKGLVADAPARGARVDAVLKPYVFDGDER